MQKLAQILKQIASHITIFTLYLVACVGSAWGAYLVMKGHFLIRKSGFLSAISFWDSFAIAVIAFVIAILWLMVLGFWCVEFGAWNLWRGDCQSRCGVKIIFKQKIMRFFVKSTFCI